MGGFGFMSHMVTSYKNNRALLKGEKKAWYKSFDVDKYPISKDRLIRPTLFNTMSPKGQKQVGHLLDRRRRAQRKRTYLVWFWFAIIMTGILIRLFSWFS